jgi:hypothetical protein
LLRTGSGKDFGSLHGKKMYPKDFFGAAKILLHLYHFQKKLPKINIENALCVYHFNIATAIAELAAPGFSLGVFPFSAVGPEDALQL